jgi:aspartyl aminopeptidase
MHSIRETMGVHDLTNGLNLFKAYFKHFREVDSSIEQ